MPESIMSRFVAALGELEKTRHPDALVDLFADDAAIGNVLTPEKFHGQDGAHDFWTKYRDTFDEMQSVFSNQIESDGRVALEWTTAAFSNGGKQITYEGVSILEIADDKIIRFHAYFDPASLGRQLESSVSAKRAS